MDVQTLYLPKMSGFSGTNCSDFLTYTEKLIFIRFGKWQIGYYIWNGNLSSKITNIQ